METWRCKNGTFCIGVKTCKNFWRHSLFKKLLVLSPPQFHTTRTLRLFSAKLLSRWSAPACNRVQGLYPSHMLSFTLPFAEFQDVPFGPFLKPIQFPLGCTSVWGVSNSSWFSVIRKSTRFGVFPKKYF